MTLKKQKIVFIGSGNLGYHLSSALQKAGYPVIQLYSKTASSVVRLAKKLNTAHTCRLQQIEKNADIYIFCINDDAVEQVLSQMKLKDKLFIHTSGSLSASVFSPYTNRYGVLYPIQTFSKPKEVQFNNIPFCVEASQKNILRILKDIALRLSPDVREVSGEQRRHIHLAAVFANNFVNHLYYVADDILKKQNIPFEILYPLIQETADKIRNMPPQKAQTGPALRRDKKIIKEHIRMLSTSPDIEKLYRLLTDSILKRQV